MPLPANDHYNELVEARGLLIEHAANIAESLVLAPRLTGAQIERMRAGIEPLVDAFEASVKAAHSSSNSAYALTDLPPAHKEAYDRARHALGLLAALYGPKVADNG